MTTSSVERERGFTESERNEIITKIQGMENRLAQHERYLVFIAEFCGRLGAVLDAIGNNPMLAAMMPPGFADAVNGNGEDNPEG